MKFDPKDIVEHLRHNLERYPYGDGFTVFRELLQNADDARSTRVALQSLNGWPEADNPLLNGPGLLLINDGEFDARSAEGMQTFGGSMKASDQEAVGRFGLGQKSVFHICDAFIVVPHGYGDQLQPFVVNPFEAMGQTGDACLDWKQVGPKDANKIVRAGAQDGFAEIRLSIWFPLRRADLRPKPKSSGIEASDIASESLRTLADRWKLAELLAALRHVRRIEVQIDGESVVVDRDQATRMTGYKMASSERLFSSDLGNQMTSVGRELMARPDFCNDLRQSSSWPRTRNRLTDEEEPQKASPHGAVILLVDPNGQGGLSADWSVLLPVTEALPAQPMHSAGRVKLFLHGCFFVDSGRKALAGFSHDPEEVSGQAQVRAGWNWALRDEVVLPLLPGVFFDAFKAGMFDSAKLAELLSILCGTHFVHSHRTAIARRDGLARVMRRRHGGIVASWSLTAGDIAARPFPAPDIRGRIAATELFEGLADWVDAHGLVLVAGPDAALLSDTPAWTAEELGELLNGLGSETFLSRVRAEALAAFLEVAVGDNPDLRQAAGPRLLMSLRRAMVDDRNLAPGEALRQILHFLPPNSAVGLPDSAGTRAVLRVFACRPGDQPVLRGEWLEDDQEIRALSLEEAVPLLSALQPLLKGDSVAEAAGAASLSIVRLMADRLNEAARDPEIARLGLLRAGDGSGRSRLASLEDLFNAARERRLFRGSPPFLKTLKALHEATQGVGALALSSTTGDLLERIGPPFAFTDPSEVRIAQLVTRAERFGPPEARGRLLDRVFTTAEVALPALRTLVAGDGRAAVEGVSLVALQGDLGVLDSLVRELIDQDLDTLLAPAAIIVDLNDRQKRALGILSWDAAALGDLLQRHAEKLLDRRLNDDMITALLDSNLDDADLRALPLFTDMTGRRQSGDAIWRETPEIRIPASLRELVPVLAPSAVPAAHARTEQLVEVWSSEAQIRIALKQHDPHHFTEEILSALAICASQANWRPTDSESLRRTAWLRDHDGQPWASGAILDLPKDVMEAVRQTPALGSSEPFLPLGDLAPALQDPQTVQMLRSTGVLFDPDRMKTELLRRIEVARPVALYGDWRRGSAGALARLATGGANLPLPGWPLLAALLRDTSADHERIITPFGEVRPEETDIAARALSALAELVKGGNGEAWPIYLGAFQTVASWPEPARQAALGGSLIRTRDGSWRLGQEVSALGGGISKAHLLDDKLSTAFPRQVSRGSAETDAASNFPDASHPPQADPKAFEQDALNGLRAVLTYAKPHVPSDLLMLLVGLLGQSEGFALLARTAIEGSEADLRRIWSRLDNEVAGVFIPTSQQPSLQARREDVFVILQPVCETPATLEVETLSGEIRALPVEDLTPLGMLGDLHIGGFSYPVGQRMLRRKPVLIGVPPAEAASSQGVRKLCLALAELMIGYRDEQTDAFAALDSLAEDCDRVEQALVESVRDELEDRLPAILAELKPRTDTRLRAAREVYEMEISATPLGEARERARRLAKDILWQAVIKPTAQGELLATVRGRIEEYGYDVKRVLFELFQNADDATTQHPPEGEARFCILSEDARIRTLHWGRLLNHLGPDTEKGAREGWTRDLLNMLLLNVSDKTEDVTGRFGLGFKSVHLLACEVGVASRFVACRVHGGMLPTPWSKGRALSEEHRQGSRPATVIDLELDTNAMSSDGAENAIAAFKVAARWLPAMSRAIRCVEIAGDAPRRAERRSTSADGIEVVVLTGPEPGQAIALDLGDETTLFVPLHSERPVAASTETPRLWLLAPLEEHMESGWLLNRRGFRVDPGRGRLAGTKEERKQVFKMLGQRLGPRLVNLFDLIQQDLSSLVNKRPNEAETAERFVKALFDFFALDFNDTLAGQMHGPERGLGRLVAERPALPTGLPTPFAPFVAVETAEWELTGVLADPAFLSQIRGWSSLADLHARSVGPKAADRLERLKFPRPKRFDLCKVVSREIGGDLRVHPDIASRMGQVLTKDMVEELESGERQALLALFAKMSFLMMDAGWRPVALPPRDAPNLDDEDRRILAFAPDASVASADYIGAAVSLYQLARYQSGYRERQLARLVAWAGAMTESHDQEAVLRYVLDGDQGRRLADELKRTRPGWLPETARTLEGSPLMAKWVKSDVKALAAMLHPEGITLSGGDGDETAQGINPSEFLGRLSEWWECERAEERERVDRDIYPEFFSLHDLRGPADEAGREGWFTFFALGIFRTIGRTSDTQHRNFIDNAHQAHWWTEMASAQLPDDPGPWIQQLEQFASASAWRIDFPQWRRTLTDLYILARWLPDYVDAFKTLPAIVQQNGNPALSDSWRLSASPLWQRRGLEGGPLSQSLGLGANWMIREAVRHGVWADEDAVVMHRFGWASTGKLRRLFQKHLGYDLGDSGNMDLSPNIYRFVAKHLGDGANFFGDLDLPLQIVAGGRRDDVLQDLFSRAEIDSLFSEDFLDDDEELFE